MRAQRLLLVLLALAGPALAQDAPNRELYLDRGADREQRLIAGAKKEGTLTLYSTMTVSDGKAFADAFERRYGVRLVHWRTSSEKIVQRAVAETRAKRYEADVIESSAPHMEALRREGVLEDFDSPSLAQLVPGAVFPGNRQYVADRLVFFVMGWNTNLVKPSEVPKTYEDLLDPRWAGRITIEGTDVSWFAAVTLAMGEAKGLAYFKRLAAQKPQIRSGHILTAQLVASGEVPFFLTAYNNNIETLKKKGAPIDWRPLQPAFGQAAAVGVAKHAPHPHAALLFADFILSREGQEIYRKVNRVPTSARVDSPLNKFPYQVIDPLLTLDEDGQWSKLFSALFLGGEAVQKGE
ncbi:MAG TPA: extracellular solute-binding protein [Burkholderiales bacterium]